MKSLVLLNTTIVTTDGSFELKTISLEEAREIVAEHKFVSAIGHESTAKMMNTLLLRDDIEANRYNFTQEVNQVALCFKIPRQTEGRILTLDELKQLPYEFKLMTRTA